METQIKDSRSQINFFGYILCVLLLISCNTYKDLKEGETSLSFTTIYENDHLDLKVNDSLVFNNHKIDMAWSLGISKNSTISLIGNKFRLKGKYNAVIDPEFNIARALEFDTVIYAKDGRYIDVKAGAKKVYVEQRKKIRKIE